MLELASAVGADARKVHLAGIPDAFIQHGPRSELLGRIGLDAAGIAERARELRERTAKTLGISYDDLVGSK